MPFGKGIAGFFIFPGNGNFPIYGENGFRSQETERGRDRTCVIPAFFRPNAGDGFEDKHFKKGRFKG